MDLDNQDYIVHIQNISSKKRNISSIVTLASVNISENLIKNNLPKNIVFVTSLTDYLNNNITFV